jgi:uncharacterized membrane protein YebE (DUF533 family)
METFGNYEDYLHWYIGQVNQKGARPGQPLSLEDFYKSVRYSDKSPQRSAKAPASKASPSESENTAILNLLVWLGLRDGTFDEAELTFVKDKMQQMGVSQLTSVEAIKALKDPSPLLSAIQSSAAKQTLLEDMIQLSFVDGSYDARERVAIGKILQGLELSWNALEEAEHHLTRRLKQSIEEASQSQQSQQKSQDWDVGKMLTIAAWAVGGGAVLAATGGLAAPLIGGAIGTSLLGLSGAAATSAGLAFLGGGSLAAGGLGMAGGTAIVTAALGASGAGLAAWKANHLCGDIKEWEIEHIGGEGLHVCLGISGFLQQDQKQLDVWKPLLSNFPCSANYTLTWESKAQRDLLNVISSLSGKLGAAQLTAIAAQSATKKAFGMMALPAAVLSAFEIIDNPWWVAQDRAEKAGKLLGDYIAENQFGGLPVSLMGYSLGTKVIIKAINRLAELGLEGKIFDVYLLAGAVAENDPNLRKLSQIISGKVVNVYSRKDIVLSYMYRAAELFAQPIGNQPLQLTGISVVNIDVTDSVGGHLQYVSKLDYILNLIRKETGQSNLSIFQCTDTKATDLVQEIQKCLWKVPGMTPANLLDFDQSELFARLPNQVTIRTWKNIVGVEHVFIAKNDQCVFGGYVGWVHSEGLKKALQEIKRKFG